MQLENASFQGDADIFTLGSPRLKTKIKELIEAGFEYVCEKDGLIYFRKRK